MHLYKQGLKLRAGRTSLGLSHSYRKSLIYFCAGERLRLYLDWVLDFPSSLIPIDFWTLGLRQQLVLRYSHNVLFSVT